jgi:hypothetical protein
MAVYYGPGNHRFTFAELEGLWINYGGPAQYAGQAAAVAIAESGGNSSIFNSGGDMGLWQINCHYHPQFATCATPSNPNSSAFDIPTNVRAAISISNQGRSWAAWCTAWSITCSKGTYWTGSAAAGVLAKNGGTPPNTNVPTNPTNAAGGQPPTGSGQSAAQGGGAATLTTSSAQDCSGWDSFMWITEPWNCAQGAASTPGWNLFSGIVQPLIQGAITSIFNPIIVILGGVIGITSGAAMMIFGLYLVFQQTQTGQGIKQGIGTATKAAAWLAGPEAGAAAEKGAPQHQVYLRKIDAPGTPEHGKIARTVMVRGRQDGIQTTFTQRDVIASETDAYKNLPEGPVGDAPRTRRPPGSRPGRRNPRMFPG